MKHWKVVVSGVVCFCVIVGLLLAGHINASYQSSTVSPSRPMDPWNLYQYLNSTYRECLIKVKQLGLPLNKGSFSAGSNIVVCVSTCNELVSIIKTKQVTKSAQESS